jgi:hypothetical protein
VPFNTVFFKNKVYNFEIQRKNGKRWYTVDSDEGFSQAVGKAMVIGENDSEPLRVYSRRSKRPLFER